MEFFLFFILGMATVQWIFPLLDQFASVIDGLLETIKGCLAVKMAKYNATVCNINKQIDSDDEEKEICHSVMGFQFSDNTDEDEEDYDDL